MTAPLLRVRDIGYAYPRRSVLSGYSADFMPGIAWLQGPNGSGKTTLLKLLAGALPPDRGEIDVQGIAQHTAPLEYRRRVAWCGPDAPPFDHLTAPEYIGFLRTLYPGFDLPALTAHLQGFALMDHLQVPIRKLSTGTQRKVGLAAMLSCGTQVVLLDEPLNALDAASSAYLKTTLTEMADQSMRLCVVASHEAFGPAAATAAVHAMGAR